MIIYMSLMCVSILFPWQQVMVAQEALRKSGYSVQPEEEKLR